MSAAEDQPMARGRSTLLRAGQVRHRRRRAWAARYLTLTGIVGAVTLAVRSVQTDRFAPEGAARWIYVLHDSVWLRLKGTFWTAHFPESLIWASVVTGIALLLLAEFLGVASGVRRGQVAVLRRLIFRAPGILVLWHHVLASVRLRNGLAETLIRDLRQDALLALTRDRQADPQGTVHRRLCHLTGLQLRLGAAGPRDLVAVVDSLGLAALDPQTRMDRAARLASRAARIVRDGVPDWPRFAQAQPDLPDLAETLDWADSLSAAAASDVVTLASRAVLVARAIVADGGAGRLAFFDAWARVRAGGPDPVAATLAHAEDFCAFEFWAATAEGAADRAAPATLLAAAFPGLRPERDRGERFAQGDFPTGGAA